MTIWFLKLSGWSVERQNGAGLSGRHAVLSKISIGFGKALG